MSLQLANLFLWAVVIVWLAIAVRGLLDVLAIPSLPRMDVPEPSRRIHPSVSIVVPVRNEAERIGATIQRLLEQKDVDLEVIAVDDRSTDGSGPILDGLAKDEKRLKVVHVRE